jgi:eukaryotic-like serine/threonine-protein kinase
LNAEGIDGRELIEKSSRLPIELVLHIGTEIARALESAHAAKDARGRPLKVVPRDLSPDNVLIAWDGAVKLKDLGIGKRKPQYTAPEQERADEVDVRTDLFALGCTLHELAARRSPLEDDEVRVNAIAGIDPPLSESLDEDLEIILESVLTADRNRRLPDARSLTKALAAALDARSLKDSRSFAREWLRSLRPRSREDAVAAPIRREPTPAREQAIPKSLENEVVAPPSEQQEKEKKRSVSPVPLAVAAALMIAVGAGGFAFRHFAESRIDRAVDPRVRPSIAMLAFRNQGDADASWIATALGERIRSELSLGDRIRIVAPETAARMKTDLSVGDSEGLAKETLARVKSYAAADMVLTGSYRRDGDRTTLELTLQDTVREQTIAGGSFSGGDRELVELAARAAESLRSTLQLPAPPRAEAELARASIPQRGEAQRWYAEGLDALRRLDALPARELFQKALVEEPDHPLLHLALAEAWSALGYDPNAAEEAKLAVEHAAVLPPRERLWAEARHAELAKDRARSVALYRALFRSFPDDLGYGLRLAETEARAGTSTAAAETFAAMRSLPAPLSDDPRIDLLAAKIAGWRGDFEEQRALAEHARESGVRINATEVIAQARYMEGWALRNLGDRTAAAFAYQEARAYFVKAGDRAGLARSLNDFGILLRDAGRIEDARDVYEQSLAIQREIGRRADMAEVLSNLAEVHRLEGDLALASAHYEEALRLCEEDGRQIGMLVIHANLAEVAFDRGNFKEARRLLDRALADSRTLGNVSVEAYVLNLRGEVELAAGDLALAERRFFEALAIRETIGEKETQLETRLSLARLETERGRATEAAKALEAILTETASSAPARIDAEARLLLARALRESKRAAEAEKAIAELDHTAIESASLRLALGLERARLKGDAQLISAIAGDAKRTGFVALALEARLARAELVRSRWDLIALTNEATARGFGGIARRAKKKLGR